MLAISALVARSAHAGEITPPHVVEVVHASELSLDIAVDAPTGPTTAVVVSSSLSPERYATTQLRDSGDQVAVVSLTDRERRALAADQAVLFRIQPLTFDALDGDTAIGAARNFVVAGGQLDGLRPDRLLFGFLGLALFGVLWLYRREPDREHRLRLAGAAGLISVLFLCTTPAMPWTERSAGGSIDARCPLGDEATCAVGAAPEVLDHAEWAAAAIRAGHMTIILLLLPACIWLMVAPRNRGAQALMIGGAAPALFTALATALLSRTVAPWHVDSGGPADLTLLACTTLLIVATTAGLLGRELRHDRALPGAVVVERRL